MENIAKLINTKPTQSLRSTERGDLLVYFAGKLNVGRGSKNLKPITIGRVAALLAHCPKLEDLYFIKSDCDQAERRGIPWGAAFFSAIKAK